MNRFSQIIKTKKQGFNQSEIILFLFTDFTEKELKDFYH
jgi:hypothetical protein